jgi:hypothetical protein
VSGESFIWSTAGVRMQIFFICSVRSPLLCSARADFLGHFCSARALAVHACQGRPFFSCPVTSSAARKFEFFFCCFWFSDHTGQNQLNWPLGAVELVLRTSSTAYIYFTLPFSSPTSFTLALVASQPLEPLLHTLHPLHIFTTFSNHGASSQPLCGRV